MSSDDLRLDEDRTMTKSDARWFRLSCPRCDLRIEARVEPASDGESLIAAFRQAHDQQLHVEPRP